ncbi:MAG: extracellular solute-binding protein [bacterium]
MTRSLTRLVALITLIPLLGLGCKASIPAGASTPIKLTFWGVFDDASAYGTLIKNYRGQHQNVSIEYRKFRIEEYDRELLNAFAEDRGPDIFMIHNTSIPSWFSKITPLPPSITMPVWSEQGSIKKEIVVTMVPSASMTATQMRRTFPDVVARDAVIPTLVDERTGTKADRIYGIPTSIDTMALFYNKDLLSAAGIAEPPADWATFSEDVQKITKINPEGGIIQSGAAIGTSSNVERSTDLLALLMMQSGAVMTDDFGRPTFDQLPLIQGSTESPGAAATRFYTQFASPTRTTYTWSPSMPNSFEAFAAGKTAMMFGYSYHLPLIKARAPKLNFDVTSMPQLQPDSPTYYANYWLNSVSKKSKNVGPAWSFVQFLADPANVPTYLAATGKPPALRTLATVKTEDPYLPIWNNQVLTARSWYRGKDTATMEAAMKTLIDQYLAGGFEDVNAPVSEAVKKITQTLQ